MIKRVHVIQYHLGNDIVHGFEKTLILYIGLNKLQEFIKYYKYGYMKRSLGGGWEGPDVVSQL